MEEEKIVTDEEIKTEDSGMSNDELKQAVNGIVEKVRLQAILMGAQTICAIILQKIQNAQSKPGKRTMNDYKRLVKDIEEYCKIGISREVKDNGTTVPRGEKTEE